MKLERPRRPSVFTVFVFLFMFYKASENDLQNKRLKLDYEEITPCLKDVTLVWEKMLNTPGRAKIKADMEKIHAAVGQGVPRYHRGEIWKFLAEQYLLRHQMPSRSPIKDVPYKELLKQLTTQQHAILIDLGKFFLFVCFLVILFFHKKYISIPVIHECLSLCGS
ncbi:unnamed protein product [Ranitomeya imitator]|uniref:Uncharacterized protein n=1 Tax=Ranitomeya imitator TaxID=111125 RepID=A0ABN9LG31_9NEOB|nr:unnamed protein product [Ranitomeya imitator]